MPAKLTYEFVKDFFENERGFKLLEKEYVNSTTPMRYICVCGNESKISFKNVRKVKNCYECSKKIVSQKKSKYTHEQILTIFKENGCELLQEYHGRVDKPLAYKCVCGNDSRIKLTHFLNGHRCKNCGYKKIGNSKRKYSIEEVREMFSERGKELLAESFVNSTTPMPYICSCGEYSTINLNNFLKEKDCYVCRNNKISETRKDSNITDEERVKKRQTLEYKRWRELVYKRDNYACQRCRGKDRKINAHHITNYTTNENGRTDVDNGITLCRDCHYGFHQKYGFYNNDEFQLQEYIKNYQSDAS